MGGTLVVTGGAGFIGSAVIRHLIEKSAYTIVNIDKLTYAGNLHSLERVAGHPRYRFERADIGDRLAMERIFREHRPNAIMHLAAESHVDRSIDGPSAFIETNIVGTYTLLEVVRLYWSELSPDQKNQFRFHHVSTDEVYGSLGATGHFNEASRYEPNSPYSASKASSDHLVRAWHHTFGLPVVTSNCSNNFGPYQFPEKLIPLMIINALQGKPLPIYGKGENIRDWLYVDDHVRALRRVLEKGKVGEVYTIGGRNERRNIDVVNALCALLDEFVPASPRHPHATLIRHVKDRPGHDKRYAIDDAKIRRDLGWSPRETFDTALRKTVAWYLENTAWWQAVLDGSYRRGAASAQVTGID